MWAFAPRANRSPKTNGNAQVTGKPANRRKNVVVAWSKCGDLWCRFGVVYGENSTFHHKRGAKICSEQKYRIGGGAVGLLDGKAVAL
jgi:hypothetical protein